MASEKKFIQLKKARLVLVGSNPIIIKMEAYENEFFEEDDIKEIRRANLELSDNKPFFVLLDTSTGYFNVSPEGNTLLASKEYAQLRKATAIIAKSFATKLAGNFFIRFNKPPTPTRLFTDEAEAIKWLKGLPKIDSM